MARTAYQKAWREEREGWLFGHIEGDPKARGYQYGYLFANEIQGAIDRISYWATKSMKKTWRYFRETAEAQFLGHLSPEYKTELEAITAGARDGGQYMDFIDVVALNGYLDTDSFYDWQKLQASGRTEGGARSSKCSAFVATGNATRDGDVLTAHSSWWPYMVGSLWNLILHVQPAEGHELLMETVPGFLNAGMDWYVTSGGLIITETTIAGMQSYEPTGTPVFIRSRRAAQYASSIDEWVKIMVEGNNGGNANTWFLADVRTKEIAALELGLRAHHLKRTQDGVLVGCNLARSPEVRAETKLAYDDPTLSCTARAVRWDQLMAEHHGKLDVELAKLLLADHYDTGLGKDQPSRATLCGHYEDEPRDSPEVQRGPFYPSGAFNAKITSGALARAGCSWFKWGKPCGRDFIVRDFYAAHPEYKWQDPELQDLRSHPWTLIDPRRPAA